jgi:hypothetical protein
MDGAGAPAPAPAGDGLAAPAPAGGDAGSGEVGGVEFMMSKFSRREGLDLECRHAARQASWNQIYVARSRPAWRMRRNDENPR